MPVMRRSVTSDLAEFNSLSGSAGSKLYVDPAPDAPANANNDFDIDLTVGNAWSENWTREAPVYYQIPGGGVRIPAGASAIIEVAQRIKVPENRFGLVTPKARQAFQSGFYPVTTKVDPTYDGYLKLLVRNHTRRTQTLRKGDPIASLALLTTSGSVTTRRNYDAPATATVKKRAKVGAWFQDPWTVAWVGTTVGTILGTIAGTLLLIAIGAHA